MVYINSTSGSITLPRHTFRNSDYYTLLVQSNMSNKFTLVDEGQNISTNLLYYKFVLNDVSLNTGEYTYKLYDSDDVVIETGLITYGDYIREVTVNNTFNKEKIQYNG